MHVKHITTDHTFMYLTISWCINFEAQIANWKRGDLKSQNASEIATKIASKSLEKRADIATEIAVIRIAAFFKSIASGLALTSLAIWAFKCIKLCNMLAIIAQLALRCDRLVSKCHAQWGF